MTEEQILQLAKKHLEVLISDDEDGEHPTDFAATYNQIMKFALAIHEDGYSEGFSDGRYEESYMNSMNGD